MKTEVVFAKKPFDCLLNVWSEYNRWIHGPQSLFVSILTFNLFAIHFTNLLYKISLQIYVYVYIEWKFK